MTNYIGMVTTDWSECLAPCGPFDVVTHHHPHLRDEMEAIFRGYTGHAMTLTQAADRVARLLPEPMAQEQMDGYLDAAFAVYADVLDFRQWCRSRNILFMINSTGPVGYFQRVFAKGLMSPPEVLAAHPMMRYASGASDPGTILPIAEIRDKPLHSAAVARRFGIPPERTVVIGDSGGDGPHFEWGAAVGATLVASLAKPSLTGYCRSRNIEIHLHWDPGQATGKVNHRPMPDAISLPELVSELRQCFGLR